jgi:chromosome segregation ATPase
MTDVRQRLAEALGAAKADVTRLRGDNADLAEAFRADPTEERREQLRRAAASLSEARDRVESATAALDVFDANGTEHGLVAREGHVMGSIAVALAPGSTRAARASALEAALGDALTSAATELGLVLGAAPERYTRERPGRDADGNTVLDVLGRVEGDVLVPAVSGRALRRT